MRYTVIFDTRITPATSATVRNFTSARAGSAGRTASAGRSGFDETPFLGVLFARSLMLVHRCSRHVSLPSASPPTNGTRTCWIDISGTGGADAIAVPHLGDTD